MSSTIDAGYVANLSAGEIVVPRSVAEKLGRLRDHAVKGPTITIDHSLVGDVSEETRKRIAENAEWIAEAILNPPPRPAPVQPDFGEVLPSSSRVLDRNSAVWGRFAVALDRTCRALSRCLPGFRKGGTVLPRKRTCVVGERPAE